MSFFVASYLLPIYNSEAKLEADMSDNRFKFIKTKIDAIEPSSKEDFYWDTDLRGFGLRVSPKGKKTYIAFYRFEGGQRRPAIGVHGVITCSEARELARQVLAGVERGEDYSTNKQKARQAPSFKEFASMYMEEVAPKTKRVSSIKTDEQNLRLHLLPSLGGKKMKSITKADVTRLHNSMRQKPGAANRSFALLSHMMSVAEELDIRPQNSNLCRHIKKYSLQTRERHMSSHELGVVAEVLREAELFKTEMQSVIDAIRLLILTGCRKSEITTLKWSHVDFENGALNLPTSKTGAKTVYLSAPALEVLNGIDKVKGNPYVITGQNKGAHLVNLRKPWVRIREAASMKLLVNNDEFTELFSTHERVNGQKLTYEEFCGMAESEGIELPSLLTDVRLHDLRHSFASVGVASGMSLPMIGKLLGHKKTATTERYAHLASDPIKEANEALGKRLADMMTGSKESADIVELKRK